MKKYATTSTKCYFYSVVFQLHFAHPEATLVTKRLDKCLLCSKSKNVIKLIKQLSSTNFIIYFNIYKNS